MRSFCGRFNSNLCFLCHVYVIFINSNSQSVVPFNRVCCHDWKKGLPHYNVQPHVRPLHCTPLFPSPLQHLACLALPLSFPSWKEASPMGFLVMCLAGKAGMKNLVPPAFGRAGQTSQKPLFLCGRSSLIAGILVAWALTALMTESCSENPWKTS